MLSLAAGLGVARDRGTRRGDLITILRPLVASSAAMTGRVSRVTLSRFDPGDARVVVGRDHRGPARAVAAVA